MSTFKHGLDFEISIRAGDISMLLLIPITDSSSQCIPTEVGEILNMEPPSANLVMIEDPIKDDPGSHTKSHSSLSWGNAEGVIGETADSVERCEITGAALQCKSWGTTSRKDRLFEMVVRRAAEMTRACQTGKELGSLSV